MIHFVTGIIVGAPAQALTIIFSEGIDVHAILPRVLGISATYLVHGSVFGLISARVRLIELLFTARPLFRTVGSLARLINACPFRRLSAAMPEPFSIAASPKWLRIMISGKIIVMERSLY